MKKEYEFVYKRAIGTQHSIYSTEALKGIMVLNDVRDSTAVKN